MKTLKIIKLCGKCKKRPWVYNYGGNTPRCGHCYIEDYDEAVANTKGSTLRFKEQCR